MGKLKKKSKKGKRRPVNLPTKKNTNTASSTNAEHVEVDAFPGGADLYPDNPNPTVRRRSGALADLHMHSVCSDGKYRPAVVMQMAAAVGVEFVSLTDHDTMAGVSEATETAKECGMLCIPGVEISTILDGENIHILAYFCPGIPLEALEAPLAKLRDTRHTRGKTMLAKLKAMGIVLSWDRVLEIAGEAAPGRPHVAEALVEAGHVPNFREAFNRYLSNNGPAYAVGFDYPPQEAIALIAACGGISVLAHPWCCKNALTLVPTLAKAGLMGLEVYNSADKIDLYRSLAKESNLIMTGGSDFHGISPESERQLGDIAFSQNAVSSFLEVAAKQWSRPLLEHLDTWLADTETPTVSLCFWEKQQKVVVNWAEKQSVHFEADCKGSYCTMLLSRISL